MVRETQMFDPDAPVLDFEEAITFIEERSNYPRSIIERVLLLEEDYMRLLGIVIDFPEES